MVTKGRFFPKLSLEQSFVCTHAHIPMYTSLMAIIAGQKLSKGAPKQRDMYIHILTCETPKGNDSHPSRLSHAPLQSPSARLQ